MTEIAAPKKKKRKYYRSPLDKLVSNSGFTAKAIAAKMGITYDRMVALRRIKEITKTDLELCRRAIEELTLGNDAPLQEVPVKASQNSFNEHPEIESLEENVRDVENCDCGWKEIANQIAQSQMQTEVEMQKSMLRYEPLSFEHRLAVTSLVLGKCWAILDGLSRQMTEPGMIGAMTLEHIEELRQDVNRLFYS